MSRAQHSLSVSRFRFPTVEAFFPLAKPECNTLSPSPVFFLPTLPPGLFPFPLHHPPLPTTRHSCCWITERMWRAPCRMGRRTTQRPLYSWLRLQVQSHSITFNHIPITFQSHRRPVDPFSSHISTRVSLNPQRGM